jgi:hypothetical protein
MNALLQEVRSAAKANILPGLVLQTFALALVLSFFFIPSTAPIFQGIADIKATHSTLFAIVSTSLFGGLVPFVFLYLKKKIISDVYKHLLFYIVLWAFMGWLIDSFYQLQSLWFGDNNEWQTIMRKTLMDQFVFSVFITSPFLTFAYIWRQNNFKRAETFAVFKTDFFSRRLPATIISTWCVWLPAVTLIYTMPGSLQLPLFNIVLCFFVLLVSALGRE